MITTAKTGQTTPQTPPPPPGDPNFQGRDVKQVEGITILPNLTESEIGDLNNQQPLLTRKTETANTNTAPLGEVIASDLAEAASTIKKLTQEVHVAFASTIAQSKVLNEREESLAKREETLKSEVADFNKKQADALKDALDGSSGKSKQPNFLVIQNIVNRMPGLLQAYTAMESNPTSEAKAKFVSTYISEITSAFKNIVSIQNETIDVIDLKNAVSTSLCHLKLFEDGANKEVLSFIQLSLNQIQDPKAPVPTVSKAALAATWIRNLLASLKCFIALTTAYLLGNFETSLLALLPNAINNLISAIQDYAGAPTVPLLCFGVAYLTSLLVQYGRKVKEAKWPTAPEVKEKIQFEEVKKLFAQQAIAV